MLPTEWLKSTAPPWVHLCVLAREQTPETLCSPPAGFVVRHIDGGKCETKTGLLFEFARALEFPPYFGQNWDAFEECLTDLTWLPAAGYLIIITESEHVLMHSDRDYATFIEILQAAGQEWATVPSGAQQRPPVPFHVILTVSAQNYPKRTAWRLAQLNC